MSKTNLIIHIVIDEDTAIVQTGTIAVSRGDLGHLRAFKTTKASDTVYAIEQAIKELVELERKEPVHSTKSKSKLPRPSLSDAPADDEDEDTPEADEEDTTPDPKDQPASPASAAPTSADELNFNLISVTGTDQSPAAYKHAVLLAEALRAGKMWNNTTEITFDTPVHTWTQLQSGNLSLPDVLSLYTTAAVSPDPAAAPAPSESLTAQTALL